MNVIPKYLQGGDFSSLFTEYQPIQILTPRTQKVSSEKKQTSNEDKGKLTEKDFFNMIKDIDGLPNEMKLLINNLTNTFQMENLVGSDVNDLATTYLSSLYQLKVAKQNKAKYDKIYDAAEQSNTLQEPAITPNGNLIVQTEDGKISQIDLSTYFNSPDEYSPLTVSNLAWMRKHDPSFAYDEKSLDIIQNSMSFEKFLKLLDEAKAKLGTLSYTKTGSFSTKKGKAIRGLELLQNLNEDDLNQIAGSFTADGLYEYKIIDKNLKGQIDALVSYLLTVLPNRAKTWAAFKLGTDDKYKATRDLIFLYLLSTETVEHTIDPSYKGSVSKVKDGKGKSGRGSDSTEPYEGFWLQLQSGKGGNDSPYTIVKDNGLLVLEGGKYYGATPGPEQDCSLRDYITKSGASYVRNGNITFGNIELSKDSYNDVMVNRNSGAYAITIPVRNGKPWLEALDVYNSFVKELKNTGLKPDSPEYVLKVKDLLKNPEYQALVNLVLNNGKLNPDNSQHFLVLEGVTSSKAYGMEGNTKKSISDFESDYIVRTSDDEDYLNLEKALSNKERGNYELDSPKIYDLSDSWFDKIYKGNIFIPLSINKINAMNADDNNIKEGVAKRFEEQYQDWMKDQIERPTGSEVLNN